MNSGKKKGWISPGNLIVLALVVLLAVVLVLIFPGQR